MTIDELNSAAQATQDIASAILSAAGVALRIHGNDPNSLAILSAGFCMAIQNIEKKIDPDFRRHLLTQLGDPRSP